MTLLQDIELVVQAQGELRERRRIVEHPGFEPGMQWLERSVPTMTAYAVTPDYRVIAYGPRGRTELGVWELVMATNEGHRIFFGRD